MNMLYMQQFFATGILEQLYELLHFTADIFNCPQRSSTHGTVSSKICLDYPELAKLYLF